MEAKPLGSPQRGSLLPGPVDRVFAMKPEFLGSIFGLVTIYLIIVDICLYNRAVLLFSGRNWSKACSPGSSKGFLWLPSPLSRIELSQVAGTFHSSKVLWSLRSLNILLRASRARYLASKQLFMDHFSEKQCHSPQVKAHSFYVSLKR